MCEYLFFWCFSFLKHEWHSVLTEKKYKYVAAGKTDVKMIRKKRNEIWAYSVASIFYSNDSMH